MDQAFFKDLQDRGLIFQSTPELEKELLSPKVFYHGIDPTSHTLHVGHLMGINILIKAFNAGHTVILLIGGATSLIGDPSGKDKERPMIDSVVIEENIKNIKKQIAKFLPIESERVIIVNNKDWIQLVTVIEFLREVGKYITVNSMIDKDSVANRISREDGISYAEFSYQLFQAYDFFKLHELYKCTVQIGGSDQWGNMIQGVELIRKKLGINSHVISYPLIINPKTGKKFGKTEQGQTISLDREVTSPFQLYQFFINLPDKLSKDLLFFYSKQTIQELNKVVQDNVNNPEQRLIQKKLAHDMVSFIHSQQLADKCELLVQELFSKEINNSYSLQLLKDLLPYKVYKTNMPLAVVITDLGLAASRSEAQRLLDQNSIKEIDLGYNYRLIKKGKKEFGIYSIL